jgi:hypothetical protein
MDGRFSWLVTSAAREPEAAIVMLDLCERKGSVE